MTPILETERLILRPLSLLHASEEYVACMNDHEVNKYVESGGDYTLQKLKEFLHEVEKKTFFFGQYI